MQNKIFFHLVDINNYHYVIHSILQPIEQSSLIDNSELFLYCNYNEINFEWLKDRHPNIKLIFQNNKSEDYEIPTLIELKKFCDTTDCNVLYLHSKGVTQPYNPGVRDWRDLMVYFNITHWEECVEKLKEYDVVGVNWTETPQKHFSGNFWWATSNYIKSLPDIKLPSLVNYKSQFKAVYGYRQDAEFWIGANNPKAYSMHQSNINHYTSEYPKEKYMEKK